MLTASVLRVTVMFVWLAAQWAMAQATGTIQGKVTDVSGAAILGAVVTVQAENGSQRTTVTDGEDTFQISSLPPGNYNVKISANGKGRGYVVYSRKRTLPGKSMMQN